MSYYYFMAGNKEMKPFCMGIEKRGSMYLVEEGHVLNIFRDEPDEYTAPYTKMPYIMGVEVDKISAVQEEMLAYIRDFMSENDQMEIWCIWLNEVEEAERRSVRVDELTAEDLFWIFDWKDYTHPLCLRIYKWTRGKKLVTGDALLTGYFSS